MPVNDGAEADDRKVVTDERLISETEKRVVDIGMSVIGVQ